MLLGLLVFYLSGHPIDELGLPAYVVDIARTVLISLPGIAWTLLVLLGCLSDFPLLSDDHVILGQFLELFLIGHLPLRGGSSFTPRSCTICRCRPL